jgi:hypothetical protein
VASPSAGPTTSGGYPSWSANGAAYLLRPPCCAVTSSRFHGFIFRPRSVIASQVEHVSITIVCGRVSSGNGSPHLSQPGVMADASNVRHDTVIVPERMSPAQVRALAERKAQAQVGDDHMVTFLHLHGSRPVGGDYGAEVEWRYSYHVTPPGSAAVSAPG